MDEPSNGMNEDDIGILPDTDSPNSISSRG